MAAAAAIDKVLSDFMMNFKEDRKDFYAALRRGTTQATQLLMARDRVTYRCSALSVRKRTLCKDDTNLNVAR